MMEIQHRLQQVCEAFRIQGKFVQYEELKNGNINRTYRVVYKNTDGKESSYILQRVNTFVFKQPENVMENIDHVTEHIRSKNCNAVTLHFHHTEDRKNYVFDSDSSFWRLFNYVPSVTFNTCDDLQIIKGAGEAFGNFQKMLTDFDAASLHVTIPDFHNTQARYDQLMKDVSADCCGKVAEVQAELDWLREVQPLACSMQHMLEKGELPLRVTHNDTKINNVLFDEHDGHPLVVIDLDTVMPGLVAHDFGDAIRFVANRVEEDSSNAADAGLKMDVFEAFTQGFLGEVGNTLQPKEVETLALGCFVLTTELSVRFLNDYINGSVYFKTLYPEHNLVRTRCQIALAKDMLRHMDEMNSIIAKYTTK